MVRPIDEDELIEHWTLVGEELAQVAGKRGATRLGFALLLKFATRHGRFPRSRGELPDNAIGHVARQVNVPPEELGFYEWSGRIVEYHRAQIRTFLGFRECTVADADKLTAWLAEHVCQRERRPERVREQLLQHLRDERVEPPAKTRLDRIIGSALRQAEQALTVRISGRIPAATAARMLALIAEASDDPDNPDDPAEVAEVAAEGSDGAAGREVFAAIKADPGNVSLKTTQQEVAKLQAIRAVQLPARLFVDVAPKVVAGWRARAAVEAPSHLRAHPEATKHTLLAALLYCRERELTDTLVDLLIATVHRINARAEQKVVKEVVAELKRVAGKENILFKITEAALDAPDGPVREVIYPAAGGVQTLFDLLHEFRSKGSTFRQHKQRVFKASYTNHYRHGLIELLEALEFRSTNTIHAPVIEALQLIKRYKTSTTNATRYYARGEQVPVDGVVAPELQELLYRTDKRGRQRILRSVYECGVFETLRDKLRCKEICELPWVWTLLANPSLVVDVTSFGPSGCRWTDGHGARRSAMSLRPNGFTEIPAETSRVARAAFPKGCLAMRVRDALGPLFADEQFSELFAVRGRPAWSPARLVLVLVLQFVEGLSDRQAADAVRGRLDWKYALVRHEAPSLRAGVKGPRLQPVAAGWRS